MRDKGHTCVILIDIGGARGVYEMLHDKDVSAIAVQFIGFGRTQLRGNTFYIVKKDVAATLSIVTNPNNPRLKVPPLATHARELTTELRNYEIRVSDAGSTTFGAFAHKTHDDIVKPGNCLTVSSAPINERQRPDPVLLRTLPPTEPLDYATVMSLQLRFCNNTFFEVSSAKSSQFSNKFC